MSIKCNILPGDVLPYDIHGAAYQSKISFINSPLPFLEETFIQLKNLMGQILFHQELK